MSVIDDLIQRGFGGYTGWNNPQAAMQDFQRTGGQGKQTQTIPTGYRPPQGQVLGASTQQGGFMQPIQQGLGQVYDWATQQAQNLGTAFLPMAAPITQAFGNHNPSVEVFNKSGTNTGTDFGVKSGTPVVLPSGRWRVVSAFNQARDPGHIGDNTNSGYGNSILVQNMDTGEKLRYSHLSQVGVRPGDLVGGQVIGLSGQTGNVTGPHLDLEYYDAKGKLGDPLKSPYMQQKIMAMQRPAPKPLPIPSTNTLSGQSKPVAWSDHMNPFTPSPFSELEKPPEVQKPSGDFQSNLNKTAMAS